MSSALVHQFKGAGKKQHIFLKNEKISIGRNEENDVILDSATVSRRHALLQLTSKGWAVSDQGSSNGVWVNETRLPRDSLHLLQERDLVEFGKDPTSVAPSSCLYQFFKKVRIEQKTVDVPKAEDSSKPKLHRVRDLLQQPAAKMRQELMENEQQRLQEVEDLKRQKEEMELVLEARLAEEREEKERELRQMEAQIQERLAKEAELEKEKNKLKTEMEQKMKARLAEEREEKEREICQMEAQIQERLAKEAELEKEKNKLKTEMEQKMKTQTECMEQKLKDREQQLKAMETVHLEELNKRMASMSSLDKELGSIKTTMEEELVCAICAELLIEATSLSCSHSFCKYCITKWMSKKKECPNCRKAIQSSVPSRVLDNYIEKVVTFLSAEVQAERKELIEERKVAEPAIVEDTHIGTTTATARTHQSDRDDTRRVNQVYRGQNVGHQNNSLRQNYRGQNAYWGHQNSQGQSNQDQNNFRGHQNSQRQNNWDQNNFWGHQNSQGQNNWDQNTFWGHQNSQGQNNWDQNVNWWQNPFFGHNFYWGPNNWGNQQ